MSEYQILKQALKNNTHDEASVEVKAVMAQRIAALKASNAMFAGVEISGDILAMSCDKIAVA